jgi:TM2 domain-containing membrane protein YozV
MVAAYVLWFFLGQFGAHRFYLGEFASAVIQLMLTILGWITVFFLFGWFFLGVLWIWLVVDLFLIPGMVRSSQGTAALFQTTTTSTTVSSEAKTDPFSES